MHPSSRPRVAVLSALSVLAVAVHLWGLYRVTGPPSPSWFPSADKLQHLVGFGLPVFVLLLTVEAYARRRGGHAGRRAVLLVTGIFALHAVVSELIQHWAYVTRSGDPLDGFFDLLGVTLGTLGFLALRRPRIRTAP